MRDDKDYRQRKFFQVFRSETKTLALCSDEGALEGIGSNYVNARVRIKKEDRRLPLIFYVAFEPDGGSPDKASMSSGLLPAVTVREQILLNRSYIPIVNRIGSTALGGSNPFFSSQGPLGFAIDIGADCDAVDVSMHLTQALGQVRTDKTKGENAPLRYGGRWICGYSITCNDRLSQEEWTDAVNKVNMMTEIYADISNSGTPVLTTNTIQSSVTVGEDVEGTGGTNIGTGGVIAGTGPLG